MAVTSTTQRLWLAVVRTQPGELEKNGTLADIVPMASIRTFIGVVPSERIRRNLANVILKLQPAGSSYKWVEQENLHVTLNFVGDLPAQEIPEFCQAVKQRIQAFQSFELSVQGIDGFPSMTQPRVVWAGIAEGSNKLINIYRELEPLLGEWGVNKDRHDYQPHLTLGRLKRGERFSSTLLDRMQRLKSHDAGICQIDKVIIFSSFLDRRGPTYTPMSTIRLI